MHELLEREDKWDVNDRFVLPRLHDLIDGGEIDRSTVHLESAYYDTADHDLQSHGIVLRRRDGDDDTGWQLKVPATEGRIEIRTSLADAPPSELEELLTGLRLGKDLVNVATIRTERTRYRIREPEHQRICAELADDQVRASVDHRLLAWREIEVEFESDARRWSAGWPNGSARRARGRRGTGRSSPTLWALPTHPEIDRDAAPSASRIYDRRRSMPSSTAT